MVNLPADIQQSCLPRRASFGIVIRIRGPAFYCVIGCYRHDSFSGTIQSTMAHPAEWRQYNWTSYREFLIQRVK